MPSPKAENESGYDMIYKRFAIVLLSLILTIFSQTLYAGDKSLSIYTPFTFATSSIAYNSLDAKKEESVVGRGSSSSKFGFGVNFGFQKNASIFAEKLAVGDASKDIYLAGIKFNSKDAALSGSGADNPEVTSAKSNKDFRLVGDFIKVSYILGLSRITQNIGALESDGTGGGVVKYERQSGYNAVFGIDILPMKSSFVHLVPLRVVTTLGRSGTSAFVSTEIGFSLPDL